MKLFLKLLLSITFAVFLFTINANLAKGCCCIGEINPLIGGCSDCVPCDVDYCVLNPTDPDCVGAPGPGREACVPYCSIESLTVINLHTTPPSALVSFGSNYKTCKNGSYTTGLIIGFDKTQVQNNCGLGDVVGDYDYRGVGSTLPYGCLATRANVTSPASTSALNIPLQENTAYFVRVIGKGEKCITVNANTPDEETFCNVGICASDDPIVSSCGNTFSTNQLNIGDIATFTTDAFELREIIYVSSPIVTNVAYQDDFCSHKKCPEGPDTSGYIRIDGSNFGASGETPSVRIIHNGQLLFDSTGVVNSGSIYIDQYLVGGPSVAPNIVASDITVWYPTPSDTQFPNNVDNVTYTVNSSYLSLLSPNPDTTNPYQAVVEAIAATYPSYTTLTSDVYAFGETDTIACTENVNLVISGAVDQLAWWQVKDSDIQANGDLESIVPDAEVFGLDGSGGYPGVAAYSSQTNLTTSNVSTTGWIANSGSSMLRSYDYDSFYNLIPDDVTFTDVNSGNLVSEVTSSGSEQYGYYWYKYDGATQGDLNLTSALNIGTKRVILLVDNANFNIASNINLTDNQGFFMVIVNGNTTIDPTVGGGGGANLEGIYVSDGIFNTGTAATQLWTRGSVVAYGGINMAGRDLGNPANSSTPSILFEFAPDQILLFPSKLGVRKINWKEVAP